MKISGIKPREYWVCKSEKKLFFLN